MADETWSYSTGRRGVSRVRVYERYAGGPIQVDYTGGDRQTLRNLANVPITDRDMATAIANRLSEKLARGAQQSTARQVLGIPERHRLKELLDRYHEDREGEWGESHTADQRHMKAWWLQKLGARTELHKINESEVEAAVRRAVDARDWSKRTRQKYLRYIMAAFRHARRKLKWIGEGQDLTAVDVPKPARGGPAYSHAEMMKLLKAAPDVDLRASVALEVAYDTQARSKAVLHLRVADYEDGLLTFRAAHDKAGKERVAVLSASATRRVEALIERTPGPWLLMDGRRQLSYDQLLRLLREVEKAADVPHVDGRGWHAVKRRGVTDARQAVGDMGAVSKQSGTLTSTLERVYEQDDMEPKRAVAEAMERLRGGG